MKNFFPFPVFLALAFFHTPAISGTWLFEDGYTDDSDRICAMTYAYNVNQNNFVTIKRIDGGKYPILFVTLRKRSWKIPSGTKMDLLIDFGNGVRFKVRGMGLEKNVEIPILKEWEPDFKRALRNSKSLKITFLSGNEKPWNQTFPNQKKTINQFFSCVDDINQSTQPF